MKILYFTIRQNIILSGLLFPLLFSFLSCSTDQHKPVRPDDDEWPVAWTSYRILNNINEDFRDIANHHVGLVEIHYKPAGTPDTLLKYARKYNLKLSIPLGTHLLPNAALVKEAGLQPEYAVMIGGVYKGKAIDRNLFHFTPQKHEIIIEPPVYNQHFAYKHRKTKKPIGHYFCEIKSPLKAEIVVPVKPYDGQQHLKIIPASITKIKDETIPEIESVTKEMKKTEHIQKRTLYQLTFDLSGLDSAMLNKTGIAVYWNYHGSDQWFIFNSAPVSAASESTHQALKKKVHQTLSAWSDANNGTFPINDLIAMRFGDECFYLTGHLNTSSPAVNFPLWDYSNSSIETFKKMLPEHTFPRTWGYPEIYGKITYSCWMYNLHNHCAKLVKTVKQETEKIAPGLLIYRNTTRADVFSLLNDHDGTGNELLIKELDVAHIDPYPVVKGHYTNQIPQDMSYYSGLARRYNKLNVPWLQAHLYSSSLSDHVSPKQMERMIKEHKRHGIDAIIWLGYGKDNYAFPNGNPASWEKASEIHKSLRKDMPSPPKAKLAVIRSYEAWAQTSIRDGMIIHPDDWLLQQCLKVWSVKHKKNYDIFEVKPQLSKNEKKAINNELNQYPYVISNIPWEGAWYVADKIDVLHVDTQEGTFYKTYFENLLQKKGWLK